MSWSALFDSYEVLNNVIKTLAATIAHLCSLAEDSAPTNGIIKTELSSADAATTTDGDVVPLNQGMTAGVTFTAWEMGSLIDYPIDMLQATPVCSSNDIIKVK